MSLFIISLINHSAPSVNKNLSRAA